MRLLAACNFFALTVLVVFLNSAAAGALSAVHSSSRDHGSGSTLPAPVPPSVGEVISEVEEARGLTEPWPFDWERWRRRQRDRFVEDPANPGNYTDREGDWEILVPGGPAAKGPLKKLFGWIRKKFGGNAPNRTAADRTRG